MKNLKILSYAVKPAIPEPNSLVVVNDSIYYYDENNIEHVLTSESIDPSEFATKSELSNYSLTTHSHAWGAITGKPTTFAPIVGTTATTALAGNTALLTIGTTATTAKAGNYVPTWSEVTSKPTTFPPTIGTTATDAKAGNYVPTWAEITSKPSTFAPVIGTTSTTAKAGNYTPSATEIVAAIEAMTPEQVTAVQTKLGITPA